MSGEGWECAAGDCVAGKPTSFTVQCRNAGGQLVTWGTQKNQEKLHFDVSFSEDRADLGNTVMARTCEKLANLDAF